MNRNWTAIIFGILIVATAMVFNLNPLNTNHTQAAFNASNLISDGEFKDTGSMSASEIQRFLKDRGSFLQSFSENGRTAAQIIYDAAHGYNEATGTISGITIDTSTGTVSPKAILVTLQKEQSLISKTTQDNSALNAAMGYACPDSGGCNSKYAGFTKQVENAAWQLRYNYERAQGHSYSDYQVGQSFCFSDTNGTNCGTYDNRATAALYRYTPHVYNGNYNFNNLFYNTYNFATPEYSSAYVSQSMWVAGVAGETKSMAVSFRNNGRETWSASGSTSVILAVHYRKDMEAFNKRFNSGSWVSSDRIAWLPNDVAPGESVTIPFTIKIPSDLSPGEYQFYVQLVAENATWLPDQGGGAWWTIKTNDLKSSYVGQSMWVQGDRGSTHSMSVSFTNSGSIAWSASGAHPVILAVHYRKDMEAFNKRFNSGSWVSSDRIAWLPNDVSPGQSVTIPFNITIPSDLSSGTYQFYVQLVCEGYMWLPEQGGGAWWTVVVN